MIQAIIKKGKVFGENMPLPLISERSALVKVMYSCISAGTEMSVIQTSGKLLIKKAMEQPENVKRVLEMIESEGFLRTIKRIKEKTDTGLATGYSLSGVVLAVSNEIKDLRIGDRVACAGTGVANHAEYVDVPRNLIVKIPDELGFEEASTVALGAIGIQAIRRAGVSVGEYVVVFGLGSIGQLTLQIVKNAGGKVIGIDLDDRRLKIGKENGADLILNPKDSDIVKEVAHFTDGFGADKVIFTAATDSSTPLRQAFQMTRKKGKVVLVGVSGMEINREDVYSKELDFLISTSYGPGRYDENYEKKGFDYPYAYVRWTENRNMQEYLKELGGGKINLTNVIEKIYPIDDVRDAFEELHKPEKPLIILLKYDQHLPENLQRLYQTASKVYVAPRMAKKEGVINVGMIGSGNFATSMHLPNLFKLKNKFRIYAIMTKTPHKAKAIANQYSAHYATCNADDILNDDNIDSVIITTRHKLHGEYVLKALRAGKNVFVDKPLCIESEELNGIKEFYKSQLSNQHSKLPFLMVGFNRRFSQYSQEAKKHTDKRINPLFMHYRINAEYLPLDHWVHGEEGGGRIIGEACHFIDLFTFFTECKVREIYTSTLIPKTQSFSLDDNRVVVLNYEDGSIATLEYFAVGAKAFPKEYLEIHFDEKTIVIDDYKSLKGYGVKLKETQRGISDKGHLRELEVFYETLQGKNEKWPIELWDMFQTTEVTFEIVKGNHLCVG
jgi:predicted dehydrogenase/threonine dehydrogenase-like Zn-dependent dehydrogenase